MSANSMSGLRCQSIVLRVRTSDTYIPTMLSENELSIVGEWPGCI